MHLSNVPPSKIDYYRKVITANRLSSPYYSHKSKELVGLVRFVFTTDMVTKVDVNGYGPRFCYNDVEIAKHELKKWHRKNFDRYFLPKGWIACLGFTKSELIDGFPSDYGQEVIDCAERLCGQNIARAIQIEAMASTLSTELHCSREYILHVAAYLRAIAVLT